MNAEQTSELRETQIVYAVFAQGRVGLDHNWLAVYSTLARAQDLLDAQDEQLRACLAICEIEIDWHPTDDYWSTPAGADASERPTLVATMRLIADEAGG